MENNNYEKLYKAIKREKERIENALSKDLYLNKFNIDTFYDADKFIEGNSINMLKYSNYLHSIDRNNLNDEDKKNYDKSLKYVEKQDIIFLERLIKASEDYNKNLI